jgi:hypothetical protein
MEGAEEGEEAGEGGGGGQSPYTRDRPRVTGADAAAARRALEACIAWAPLSPFSPSLYTWTSVSLLSESLNIYMDLSLSSLRVAQYIHGLLCSLLVSQYMHGLLSLFSPSISLHTWTSLSLLSEYLITYMDFSLLSESPNTCMDLSPLSWRRSLGGVQYIHFICGQTRRVQQKARGFKLPRPVGIPQPIYQSTKGLWPHFKSDAWGITPERVSNPEPPDSRPCV